MNIILTVSESGQVDLPADLRRSIGIEHGGSVSVRVENGELRMRSTAEVLADLQATGRKILAGDSVDQFIADRRREAAEED